MKSFPVKVIYLKLGSSNLNIDKWWQSLTKDEQSLMRRIRKLLKVKEFETNIQVLDAIIMAVIWSQRDKRLREFVDSIRYKKDLAQEPCIAVEWQDLALNAVMVYDRDSLESVVARSMLRKLNRLVKVYGFMIPSVTVDFDTLQDGGLLIMPNQIFSLVIRSLNIMDNLDKVPELASRPDVF